ncbi:MAG: tRNA guanosine(15) transglycosylase TgtA [Candidatus Lokiarchaeota archaeon]|nr:tRNA guanosine(15) transglycosylase TgtA [Candidatus Lokiarchaeota archaeon]
MGLAMSLFEIRAKDGMARLGIYTTKHGKVHTPLLMPVIHPAKSSITPAQLREEFGFQMVITNSYIIKSKDKFREKALSEGVHGLINFDGPIMTDSGTFQMYFHNLPEEEIDPLEIVDFQKSIGSDIGTILDAFSEPNVGRQQVEHDVKKSLERAKISVGRKEDMLLAGTIQGGIFPDLREHSAKMMATMDFDVHPIGGVVPLMESYRYSDIVRITLASKRHLPFNRPVHLFGCGHPMLLAQAAFLGCDFFDSALYAKFAESDRYVTPTGTLHLGNLRELPCECVVCNSFTADDMNQMKRDERVLHLMRHNLYVTIGEMKRVRQAIVDGKLFELVAARARSHPNLFNALQTMLHYVEQIEKEYPVANSTSILYTGIENARHPVAYRFHSRVKNRYPYSHTRQMLLFPDIGGRPFYETAPLPIQEVRKTEAEEMLILFVTPMGVIPWELEHVYPAQQCIYPEYLDTESIISVGQKLQEVLDLISAEKIIWLSRNDPMNKVHELINTQSAIVHTQTVSEVIEELDIQATTEKHWMLRKLRAIMAHQWNLRVNFDVIKKWEISISKGTGKMRHVKNEDDILFTIVPTTGTLAPTYAGGLVLQDIGISDDYLVTIDDEVSEYIIKGKSALAKFVRFASPNLRPGEEVLIADSAKRLLGTGRALLSGPEMLAMNRGVAVTTRHSKD